VDPRAGQLRFDAWVEQWRETVVDLRASTLARDDGYVARYLLPAFGGARLSDISTMSVRAWIADLTASGLAPATVVKVGQIMGKIMRPAVDAGLVAISPCDRVPLPRVDRMEMRFLSPSEVFLLAETMDPRYRAAVIVGAYGGFRPGELFGLRAGRVHENGRRVTVSEIVVDVEGRLVLGPPKTKAGHRTIGLPRVAADALATHLTSCAVSPDDFVFPAPDGGPVRLTNWRRRFWLSAVRSAGLEPLRPHDLRHTAVALWIAAGANPKEIATRAGHSSVQTVLDRYEHLLPGSEDRLNNALDALAAAHQPSAPVASMSRSAGPLHQNSRSVLT
jgi:integrase